MFSRKMLKTFLVLVLCGSAVVAQSGSGLVIERGNPQRTGVFASPFVRHPEEKPWESEKLFLLDRPGLTGLRDFVHGTSPDEALRDRLPGPPNTYYLPPMVSEGIAYFSAAFNEANLYAVDLTTGKLKWKLVQSNTEFTNPTLTGDLLYFGAGKILHAINPTTQNERWKFEAEAEIPALLSPLVIDGTVYVGSGDGKLHAVNAANGREKWAFNAGHPVRWKPLVFSDGVLYAAESSGTIHAIKILPIQELWTFKSSTGVWRLVINGDRLCFVDRESYVHMLDRETGKELPQFKQGNRAGTEPAFFAGKLFFGGWNSGSLFAINASTGEKLWKFEQQLGCRPPVLAGDTVYLACADEHLYALDATTGKKFWSFDTKQHVMSAPFFANGVLYYVADDGKVHGLK